VKRLLRTLSAFPLSLPLAFEPAPEPGRFVAHQADARIEVACDGLEVAWGAQEPRVRIEFAGAKSGLHAVASEPQPGRVNYLIGRNAARWRRNLPLHGRVTCAGVRPGLDLAVYGRDGRVEFDVIAAPGADLAALELAIEGADEQTLEPDGNLALRAGARRLVLRAPVAHQEISGARRAVASRFEANGPARFGFAVGPYDPSATLVIDPVLELSTFAGGDRLDTARAVAVAPDGSVLVAGTSESNDFPTTGGSFQPDYAGANDEFERGDAFVMKLEPGGADLVWATYLGGKDPDAASGVALGPSGDVFVSGSTWSKDFPVTPGAFQTERAKNYYDAFVARLGPDGDTLVYATFLGGKDPDSAAAIAVDADGNATVAGNTYSKDFPVTAGAFQSERDGRQDAFVSRLAPGGDALLWSSYLGGEEFEFGTGVALGADGSAVVVGGTSSNQFPVTGGALQPKYASDGDGFVSRVSNDGGMLLWSTFLGGKDGNPFAYDFASGVALDAYESVYVVGETLSRDLPVTPDAFDVECGKNDDCQFLDAFAAKLSADGCAVLYGTYLGDSDSDAARGVAVDARGHAHVTGYSYDKDFPVTGDAFQDEKEGGSDAILTELGPQGRAPLVYSTFLGSSDPDAGNAVAVAGNLRTHVVGSAAAGDFPIVGSAFQPDYGTGTDGFVAVFGGTPAVEPALLASLVTPSPAAVGATTPGTLRVRNAGSAAAPNVAASVTFSAGLAFVLGSATPSQGTCSYALSVLSCALGTLAPGAEAEVDFAVTPNSVGASPSTAAITAGGAESVRAAACVVAQVNDLAVTSVKAPKSVKVPAGGSVAAKVTVEIENLGNHSERIVDLAMLEDLVTLDVTPIGLGCAAAAVALDPKSGSKLPLELEPGKKLKLAFTATIDCADTDYLAEGGVDHTAIDGTPDSVPANDAASVVIETELKP
jgi:hypothetical protein